MTVLGWIILIVGALIVGVVAQLLMSADMPFRWVATSVATFIGAVVASEFLFTTTEPIFEGIAVWPALIGGLVVGLLVDVGLQWFAGRQTHGTTGHGMRV